VPFLVFLLTLAAAGGWLVLKADLLPKETAGRTVIEIAGNPGAEEMKVHVDRIQSGVVLAKAAKRLGTGPKSARSAEHVAEWLRRSIEVKADGPFLTVTAFTRDYSPPELAGAVAAAYDEDLKEQVFNGRKRENQAREAHLTLLEADVEKARLEWMEMMLKLDVTPDGRDLANEASLRELAGRIAKERVAMLSVEAKLAVQHKDDTPETKAEIQKDLDRQRESLQMLEKAFTDLESRARQRLVQQSEVDHARAAHQRLTKALNQLKEESIGRRIKESVVLVPVRVVEEAATVKVPNRQVKRTVRFAVFGSIVLLAAFLLASLAAKLCRRV